VGQDGAAKRMVIFEDPQCPYCCEFEEVSGGLLRSAREGGTLATEYQMRCFLGVESVRADNALALAAEEQRFDELRTELFAAQPLEGSGGFTTLDLVALGQRVGLTSHGFVSGVHEGRYVAWVLRLEELFRTADPQGTPAAWLDDRPVDARVLYDPEALAVLLDL
jgi:hypothetical protein